MDDLISKRTILGYTMGIDLCSDTGNYTESDGSKMNVLDNLSDSDHQSDPTETRLYADNSVFATIAACSQTDPDYIRDGLNHLNDMYSELQRESMDKTFDKSLLGKQMVVPESIESNPELDAAVLKLRQIIYNNIMYSTSPAPLIIEKLNPNDIRRFVKKEDVGKISDGYHTFDELYDHRAKLFSIICNMYPELSWRSLKHSDGQCMMECLLLEYLLQKDRQPIIIMLIHTGIYFVMLQ